ncbi:hypothetical protein PsorP6_004026 [Peronosclerospora sorghi]|uniref:Uncharacterized protein n=1 Tax=Peronosclerospora sorghi TaxID=230839 RepID=A0ACC0VQ49_9STRA|nr:hypothetical protein PsorP6_004026 [Peronosclerospora sorghi]
MLLLTNMRSVALHADDLTHYQKQNYGGCDTYMGVCRVSKDLPYRRLDIKVYPRHYFGFAMLYFTGSDHFNRSMRLFAHKNGWSLSDRGLTRVMRVNGTKVRLGDSVICESEVDVFIALGLEYKDPTERNCFDIKDKMPLFLANLAMSSYFLALCYVLITVMTMNKYLEVRGVLMRYQHTTWSTVQLLIASVALGSFFRSATFSTLCILDSQAAADLPTGISRKNPWIHEGLPPAYGEEDAGAATSSGTAGHAQAELDFYNKVVAVLFNLPDFLFVSSYLLLVLVWAEAFQSSRRHWFSAELFRRKWMIFYLIFNGGMYLTQLVLYGSLFLYKKGIFDDDKGNRLSVIPATIFYLVAAADLFLPIIIFSTWLYLTLSLSGFPFKSQSAKLRLQWVGRLVMAWSFGRILYSVMTLLTFTKVIDLPPGSFVTSISNLRHVCDLVRTQAMLLVVVFFAAELFPIYLTLDKRLLVMLSVENYEPLVESSGIYC